MKDIIEEYSGFKRKPAMRTLIRFEKAKSNLNVTRVSVQEKNNAGTEPSTCW